MLECNRGENMMWIQGIVYGSIMLKFVFWLSQPICPTGYMLKPKINKQKFWAYLFLNSLKSLCQCDIYIQFQTAYAFKEESKTSTRVASIYQTKEIDTKKSLVLQFIEHHIFAIRPRQCDIKYAIKRSRWTKPMLVHPKID